MKKKLHTLSLFLCIVLFPIFLTAQISCYDQLNISLDGNGEATISPDVLDASGSGSIYLLSFSSDVNDVTRTFTCNDVGNPITLFLYATDPYSSEQVSCWSTITIEDKVAPQLTCPPDVTVFCGADINDPYIVGEPSVSDNCSFAITQTDVESLDNCGEGTIVRTFTVQDIGGNESFCSQVINVVNGGFFGETDITWPIDVDIDCSATSTDPSNTGLPIIDDDPNCSQIVYSYQDQILFLGSDYCFKILRNWTVVNWCDESTYSYDQVIRVSDITAPTIICDDYDLVCTGYQNCDNPFYFIEVDATDECSTELTYQAEIDWYSDGVFDMIFNTNSIYTDYPMGTHLVLWTVSDECGNLSNCWQTIEVMDCAAPTVVCTADLNGTLSSNGTFVLDASELDAGSFDFCSLTLTYSFSTDPTDNIKTFTCNDVGTNTLNLWVTDDNGNQNSCFSVLVLDDPLGVCVPGACDVPSNTLATILSGNSVKLDWDAVANATKYRIRYRIIGSSSWAEVNNTINYRFLNNLQHGTTYQYGIKSVCDSGNSAWSPTATFTTTLGEFCDIPSASTANPSSSTAMLNWVSNPDDIKYKIKYKTVSGGSWITLTINSPAASLTALFTGTDYKYKLKTKCSGGWTNWSVNYFFTTLASRSIQEQTSFELYPNPAQDFIKLSFDQQLPISIRIMDLTGKIVYSSENANGSNRIDISSFESGTYLLHAIQSDKVYTKKFTKLKRE